MAIETYSGLWWLHTLDEQLRERNVKLRKLYDYASGNHPLPEGAKHWQDYYKQWQKRARTNLCGLASSAVSDRMQIQLFRSGELGDPAIDDFLWRWWNLNHLNAQAEQVHSSMTDISLAYVLTGPGDGVTPKYSVESAFQTIVENDPSEWCSPYAGMKIWDQKIGGQPGKIAQVYLPDRVETLMAYDNKYSSSAAQLTWWVEKAEANPIGRVPLVEFVNRPKIHGGGMAEFEEGIDVQDRINSNTLHLLTISQSQAFRQRYVKGLPTEDENGNPQDPPFEALVSALWAVEDLDIEFGEFQQVDLRPLLEEVKHDIAQFVMLTGLPPHYVQGDMVNAGTEAFAAAETRLVAKVESRTRVAGEYWERVQQLGGAWVGLEIPDDLQTLWKDPERKTDAQLADAALKDLQSGVPWETRMSRRGFSPQEIERMKLQRQEDAEYDAAVAARTVQMVADSPDPGIDNGDTEA